MALISAAAVNSVLDMAVQFSLRAIGTSPAGVGLGRSGSGWGAAGSAASLREAVRGIADAGIVADLIRPAVSLAQTTDGVAMAVRRLEPMLNALERHVRLNREDPDLTTLDAYLDHLNTGGSTKWLGLQAPHWREVATSWRSGLAPLATNVYFEVLEGSAYPSGLGALTVGAGFTPGATIDASLYAGGFPWIKWSGASGSGTITVTGTARNPATREVATGRTWTASLSGATGQLALIPGGPSPAPTDALIVAVSGITADGGVTAGTILVEARRPAGRPLLG